MEIIHYLNCADKKIKLPPLRGRKLFFAIIQNNSSVMRSKLVFITDQRPQIARAQTSTDLQPVGNQAMEGTGEHMNLHLYMHGILVAHVKHIHPHPAAITAADAPWSQNDWGSL